MNVPMSTARSATVPILRLVTWATTCTPTYTPTAARATPLTVSPRPVDARSAPGSTGFGGGPPGACSVSSAGSVGLAGTGSTGLAATGHVHGFGEEGGPTPPQPLVKRPGGCLRV